MVIKFDGMLRNDVCTIQICRSLRDNSQKCYIDSLFIHYADLYRHMLLEFYFFSVLIFAHNFISRLLSILFQFYSNGTHKM